MEELQKSFSFQIGPLFRPFKVKAEEKEVFGFIYIPNDFLRQEV